MTRVCLRLALVSLAVLLAVGVALVASGARPRFDSSSSVLLAGDRRTASSYEGLRRVMHEKAGVAVLARHDALFSNEGAAALARLGERLEAVGGVLDVKSLTHSRRPVRRGVSLDPREMLARETFFPLEPIPAEDWADVRRSVLSYPLARNVFVSEDGRWSLSMAVVDRPLETVEDQRALRDELDAALDPVRGEFAEVHLLGFPLIELEMAESVAGDVWRFLVAAGLLTVVILLVTFRSWAVLVVVLVQEACGAGLLLGVLEALGVDVNVYTAILFPLVAGLQLTFLTHLLSAVQWALTGTRAPAAAMATALDAVLVPSLVAATTTTLGLASLLVCDVGIVRDFGRAGALAVAVVFVASVLPPVLVALPGRRRGPSPPPAAKARAPSGWALALGRALARHRRAVLLGAILVTVALLPGVLSVHTDVRAKEFLSPSSPSRRAMEVMDRHLGGVNVFQLEVSSDAEAGVDDPEALRFMEDLRAYALRQPGVTGVFTYSQLYVLLHRLWQGEEAATDELPGPLLMGVLRTLLAAVPFPLQDRLVDASHGVATVTLRTRDMPAEAYLALVDRLLGWAADHRPGGVTLRERAGLHDLLEADRRVASSQVDSLLLCTATVFATVWVLLGSIRLAALVLATNVLPVAAIGGLLGYGGLPLNSVTVMVAAVVLGIVVDDAIHFMAFHRRERGRFPGAPEAVAWTLAHKCRPMAATTAVLASGLGLLLLTSFPPVAHFGLAAALALAVALAAVLLLLPALLLWREPAPTARASAGPDRGRSPAA